MRQLLLSLLCLSLIYGTGWGGEKFDLRNEKDRVSYSLGYQMWGNFKRQGLDLNAEAIVRGVEDAQSGTEQNLVAARRFLQRTQISRE